MDNDSIYEIFILSFKQYKRDRSYYTHKLEGKSPSDVETYSLEDEYDFLKNLLETDNTPLLKGLKTLTKMELKVILLFSEQAMSVSEISAILQQNYSTTGSHLYRAKKKLKSFF